MKKKTSLALADRLVLDLALLVADRVSDRRSMMNTETQFNRKLSRLNNILCFGRQLSNLYELRFKIRFLRKHRIPGASPKLKGAMSQHLLADEWTWARELINLQERIDEVLGIQ